MHDTRRLLLLPPSFDDPLGRQIIALHIWAVNQGLRGAPADALFGGLCEHLIAVGVPLWRASTGMRTLHPQWAGYRYVWSRDGDGVEPEQFERGSEYERLLSESPFSFLIKQAEAGAATSGLWPNLRRRLSGPHQQLDFPVLKLLAESGGTDYFAELVFFGETGDPSRGTGVGFSFAADGPEGFGDDDILLVQAVLPVVSLALMADAEHTIATGLLAAYLGEDAGRRVHAGAVARGSVETMRAVLWFADIRGFTAIADGTPGRAVVELLDEVFETLTASLRPRGGQVLKFLGDGMLATFPFVDATGESTCRSALDAATEAMLAIDRLNARRCEAGKPVAFVDLALHLGEVLYGNIGAADRLDFTVIGPAVNEAARIEALCEPLGCKVLV
jgi:adenylate cyclase